MLWWIGAILVWLMSAAWIFYMMAAVFRRQQPAISLGVLPGYLFHGVTAVLALFLVLKALGA